MHNLKKAGIKSERNYLTDIWNRPANRAWVYRLAFEGAEEETGRKDAIERNKRIADENEKRDANSAGTMLLLRVQLIEYHDRYMKIGSIPSYAYENFCQMYKAYHRLGGNGMVEKMHEEIQELHLKRKGD